MVTLSQRVKKLSIIDFKLIKYGTVFATLIIVKLIPQIMNINIWWFVGLFILCSIKPVYVFWIKDNCQV